MTRSVPAVLIALTFALATLALTGAAPKSPHRGQTIDCQECHACENPTRDDPCLTSCPRHEAGSQLTSDMGPDIVILDQLEDLYVPVRFNHKAHASMSGMGGGSCESCHHFTPTDQEHPACQDCHPRDVIHEDLSQPGLKGAYHRQCMGCHVEWDNDTACEVCHEKKAGGRLGGTATEAREHSNYEVIPLLELINFPTDYADGDLVPFHHKNHSVLYERDCNECHQQQSCQRCHVQKTDGIHGGSDLHPMGDLASVDLHDTCFQCHNSERCTDCHGRDPDDLFDHAETGWGLKSYHAKLTCRTCHGQRGAFQKLDPRCETCHPDGWKAGSFRHAVTGVKLDEVHAEIDCADCHGNGFGARPNCEGCHDEGWSYNPKIGFTPR